MINNLYHDHSCDACAEFKNAAQVTFSADAMKAAMKRIYDKDIDVMTDIERNLFDETFRLFDDALNKGYSLPDNRQGEASFLDELKSSVAVFSAFRTHRMQNDIAAQMTDDKGVLKSFNQFSNDVQTLIEPNYNSSWLNTEYNTAVIRAHQAANWKQYESEKDVLPNLRWVESTSANPGEDHRVFWGMVRPVDDPSWSGHRPGDRWNCKCGLEATAEPVSGIPKVITEKDKPAPGLDNNPGADGKLFSDTHPYIADGYKGSAKAVTKFLKKI